MPTRTVTSGTWIGAMLSAVVVCITDTVDCRYALTCRADSGTLSNVALDDDAFDLVERDLVASTVVELSRPGALMSRDSLCVLDGPAVLEVGGDAGRAEGVAADGS